MNVFVSSCHLSPVMFADNGEREWDYGHGMVKTVLPDKWAVCTHKECQQLCDAIII